MVFDFQIREKEGGVIIVRLERRVVPVEVSQLPFTTIKLQLFICLAKLK